MNSLYIYACMYPYTLVVDLAPGVVLVHGIAAAARDHVLAHVRAPAQDPIRTTHLQLYSYIFIRSLKLVFWVFFSF